MVPGKHFIKLCNTRKFTLTCIIDTYNFNKLSKCAKQNKLQHFQNILQNHYEFKKAFPPYRNDVLILIIISSL